MPTEHNSQVHETYLPSGDLLPKIATAVKIAASIRSLNKKQLMEFDVLHQ